MPAHCQVMSGHVFSLNSDEFHWFSLILEGFGACGGQKVGRPVGPCVVLRRILQVGTLAYL